MRKYLLPLIVGLALCSSQALADWTGKDASNATITFKNPGVCSSVVCVPVAQIYDGTNVVTLTTAGADGVSNTLTGIPAYARNLLYNGTTWDMWRGDTTNGAWVNVKNTLTAVTPGDGITTTIYGTAPASPVIGVPLLWNGTTYDRQKSAGATGVAAVRPTDGTRNAIIDPCEANLQSYAPISVTTATTTRIVAPSASNKTYICSLFLTSAAADNIGIVEGTGGTCGTGTAGVIGGTTAANGPNFAANGGVALHAGGKVAVAQTAGTNVDLCLITSAATPLAGGIKYVQAP